MVDATYAAQTIDNTMSRTERERSGETLKQLTVCETITAAIPAATNSALRETLQRSMKKRKRTKNLINISYKCLNKCT